MAETIDIRGHGVVKGYAEGEALVADTTLSFWGEVDAITGKVIGVGHPLEGISLGGRVLVIRSTKGSSGTPMVLNLHSSKAMRLRLLSMWRWMDWLHLDVLSMRFR